MTANDEPRHPTTPLDRSGYQEGHGETPTPSASASPRAPQARRPRRRLGLIISGSLLAVLLLLVIIGVGGELYTRNKIASCVQEEFSSKYNADADVSLPKTPLLWSLASKKLDYFTVDTKNDDPSKVAVHLRAENIDMSSGDVGRATGNGYMPFTEIQKSIADQAKSAGDQQSVIGGFEPESITGNTAAGTITIKGTMSLVLPIPVQAEVKPTVQDGKVKLEVLNATAAMFGLPPQWVQQVLDNPQASADGGQGGSGLVPGGAQSLTLQSLKVTDTGINFDIDATNTNMKSNSSGSGSCSL